MIVFPETRVGAELMKRFDHLEIREESKVQVRRWVEWQLCKWGLDGAIEMIGLLLADAERRTDVAAAAVWRTLSANQKVWLSREDYAVFKEKHYEGFRKYLGWKVEHYADPYRAVSEDVEYWKRELAKNRPPVADW